MGNLRPRYNKAREEQMQARRAGKRKAVDQEDGGSGGHLDQSNAEVIIPKTAAEKAKAREQRLAEERNAAQGRMSSKKKKRLDNYITKKLKQERRGELFKTLAATQESISTPLLLQPSSTLGSKQFKTNQDKLDRSSSLVDRKRQRVYDAVAEKKKGYHSDEDASEGDDDMPVDNANEAGPPTPSLTTLQSAPLCATKGEVRSEQQPTLSPEQKHTGEPTSAKPSALHLQAAPVTVGSGLKKGPDGQAVVPVIVKRTRKPIERRQFGKQKLKPHLRNLGITEDDETSGDDSFDSSDSAYDTHSDVEDEDEGDDGEGPSDEDPDAGASENASEGGEEGEEWGGIGSGDDESDDEDNKPEVRGEEQEDEPNVGQGRQAQKRSFKDWANEQLGLTVRTEEGTPIPPTDANKPKIRKEKPEGPIRGPLGEDLILPENTLISLPSKEVGSVGESKKKKRAPVIVVERSAELQEKRLQLPILAEEDTIMEAIRQHSVVVLCGETGSGKTTQVPQFLYEAGFGSPGSDNPGMIGVTQPRRVAAMSMATRVGEELSLPSSRVSYQIRYDATTSSTTSIKFMTDGVLLRELANDFLLTRYSVIIVDEAHERSVNTDVLIGTLSRVVRLREEMWRENKAKEGGVKPLRLIIMSATLRVTDFTENANLFKTPPPLINVTARQHPVTLHYNRKTRPDYLSEAYKKVSKIHARLPKGGILVFLTGQNEIMTLCKRLEKRFGKRAIDERLERRKRIAMGSKSWRGFKEEATDLSSSEVDNVTVKSGQADVEAEEVDLGYEPKDLAGDVDDGIQIEEEDPDALDTDYEEDDPDGLFADREEDSDTPLHVLPLYSLLPTDKQMKVFKEPPEGHRLVVVATNVAETSLTIPNIKYVVDCGRSKERNYNPANGIQSFDISWISKASAAQRSGRAGRTGPGHCYRLYSSAVYETHFPKFTSPEILRMPIEGIVLQMKAMNIDSVINFPFPTPPEKQALAKAEKVLVNLGALTVPSTAEKVSKRTGSTRIINRAGTSRITELGNSMSLFPLSPRFSKMLVIGQQHGCLPYVIAIVSVLSVGDPFLHAGAIGFGGAEGGDDEQNADDIVADADGAGAEIEHITSEEVKAKELRKLQRQAFYKAQQRHSALGKGASDVFKMLSVVGAYEYDGGSVAFCEKNFVRVKAMQEIHKLRAQISAIVQSNYPGLDAGLDPKLKPPDETQLKVLRQLLTAAFIDQIAVRKDLALPGQAVAGDKFQSTRGIAYRAVGIDEDVFIHPSSILFHSSPPECVAYQELLRTSRVYIKVVTRVNPAWLPTLGRPLCTFSRVLETAPGSGSGGTVKHGATSSTSTTAAAAAAAASAKDENERECFVVPKFAEFDSLPLAPIKATQKRIGSRWVVV